MRIYTRTGDGGETGLLFGPRKPKDDVRIEACGAADELNCSLGLARTQNPGPEIDALLARIQNDLFSLGAQLAASDAPQQGQQPIGDAQVTAMERAIDDQSAKLPPLKEFILPGGSAASAHLHMARAVCRRAERRVVTLLRQSDPHNVGPVLRYLNRLSDLLFVLARAANQHAGVSDIIWQKDE